MSEALNIRPTLASALWPTVESRGVVRPVVLAVAGTLLLTLSAKIQVPFWPVPMTMQTMAVLVIAMAYGRVLGLATVVLYLVEGAVGLPVFAGTPEKGLGLAYMAGPTGGYLVGFAVAAYGVGSMAERGWDRGVITTLAAMVAGTAIIFAFGLLWLGALIGVGPAFQHGLLPFLPGAGLKIALATALLPLSWKLLGRN